MKDLFPVSHTQEKHSLCCTIFSALNNLFREGWTQPLTLMLTPGGLEDHMQCQGLNPSKFYAKQDLLYNSSSSDFAFLKG